MRRAADVLSRGEDYPIARGDLDNFVVLVRQSDPSIGDAHRRCYNDWRHNAVRLDPRQAADGGNPTAPEYKMIAACEKVPQDV